METQSFGFAHMLCALDFYLRKPKEVVLVGKLEDSRTAELLAVINSIYMPNMSLQLVAPDQPLEKISPLLADKTQIGGNATAYVCHNFTCSAPVTHPEELKALLVS
jgi:uncharacterized protein